MIVWINGPYGGGKTTLVEELARRRPDAVVFDPEHIGFLLRQAVPVPTGNFQDLPSWREIVVASVLSIHRHHAELLLVPMTLICAGYRQEVFGALRTDEADLLEVFLEVPTDVLRRRIQRRVLFDDDPALDAEAREFCLSQVQAGVEAVDRVDRDTLVLRAGELSPAELAQAVLDRIAGSASGPRLG